MQKNNHLIKNLIDGKMVEPFSKKYFENFNPATGQVLSMVADSSKEDIDLAVEAAKKSFFLWASLSVRERSDRVRALGDLIKKHFDEFVEMECEDTGKPKWLAGSVDIPRCSENFYFYADAITHYSTQSHSDLSKKAVNITHRHPLGVVGIISPWNLPLYLLTWKIAPALVTGNCVVVKPSELTPNTAHFFGELLSKSDFPKGVINIVQGYGATAGQALCEHADISAISFTGGTVTGRQIIKTTSLSFKKVSLELGGKNPNIIFPDAPFEKMMENTLKSSFLNQGQICLCGSRILVHEEIKDKFVTEFIKRTKQIVVGDPKNKDSFLGAVISKNHQEKILKAIDQAKKDGAEVLCGGQRKQVKGCEEGYFIEPTILSGLDNTCKLNQEEIFGPVVSIQSFSTINEAINLANDTPYGLSASVWSKDMNTLLEVTPKIKSGVVWANVWNFRDLRTPFGGMKQSGYGREGGHESMNFFTEQQSVTLHYGN